MVPVQCKFCPFNLGSLNCIKFAPQRSLYGGFRLYKSPEPDSKWPDEASTGGTRTVSTTWMTPLVATMSAVVTLASLTRTGDSVIVTVAPLSVAGIIPSTRSCEKTAPSIKWYCRTETSWSTFSGAVSVATSSGSSLAKAASVGAKRVKGPPDASVDARLAEVASASSVEKPPTLAATSTSEPGSSPGGMSTVSMMWITPLEALTSGVMISAESLIVTTPSETEKVKKVVPESIPSSKPSVMDEEYTTPG
mmetsp:Transcript_9632/g.20643  ORF Transcript_9632/g.20643 Transcript_9632/m.20643 type:complete len:250 (+) Transcript_9632:125-874(+)